MALWRYGLRSKQQWDGLLNLVTKEYQMLETWVKDHAQKQQDELTKTFSEELSEMEQKWTCQEKLDLLISLQEAWEKKLIISIPS